MEATVKNTYDKLGFDKSEATELVDSLNALLCNYMVLYQKIRNFHWNVKGPEFFDVHEKFEEEYLTAAEDIDDVAERVRILGFTPTSTLKEYIAKADIEEPSGEVAAMDMVRAIVADYETLISFIIDAIDLASEHGDVGTKEMLQAMLLTKEEKHWMFSAFVAE
jgi:starvation-inducible DNA-binding protein